MRYSDDIIEEVRMKNRHCRRDILVCETRHGGGVPILGCVPSIMRKPLPFP